MDETSDTLPVRIVCQQCGEEFLTAVTKFYDPGYETCPACRRRVPLRPDQPIDTEPPDTVD